MTTPRGRRPGTGSTREAVLAAARARFAKEGYTGTTIRAVAGDAGVDPSQVMQFFHSKDELFAAVMAVPASALERFDRAFEGPTEGIGERVVRAFLESWDGIPEESEPLMATLRGAFANEQAGTALSGFIQSRLLTGTWAHNDAQGARRAGLAAAMLVGVITSRNVVGVPAIASASSDELVALLAPAIQTVLAG